MSAAFTPGPWSLHRFTSDTSRTISVDACAAHGAFEAQNIAFGAGDMLLGEVAAHKPLDDKKAGYPRVTDFAENIANAHLIAAAPTMYNELVYHLEMIERRPGKACEDFKRINAILKAARGES